MSEISRLIEQYERVLDGARISLEVNNCEFTHEKIREYEIIVDALRRAQPASEPLTLDELRGMDGEPVWIVAHPDWGHWELSEDAEDYFDCRDEDFYGMTMPPSLPDPMGRYGLHVLGWLAYRRKPGGSENDA